MLLEYKKVDKQMSVEDNSRLQKTTEYHERVRRYEKESQLIYSDSQRCLYIAQRNLEHEKVDQQMSECWERVQSTNQLENVEEKNPGKAGSFIVKE